MRDPAVGDIGWAVKAMKNGHRVRRKVWAAHPAVIITDYVGVTLATDIPGMGEMLIVQNTEGHRYAYGATHGDLIADDWELA